MLLQLFKIFELSARMNLENLSKYCRLVRNSMRLMYMILNININSKQINLMKIWIMLKR